MSSGGPSRGRLGGLGALFFLGTLGAIAFYVQRQQVPQSRDEVRKAATIVPEEAKEVVAPTLPWNDRLDLRASALVPFAGAAALTDEASDEAGSAKTVATADGRYVQELGDGHRILLTLDPVLQDSAETIFRKREVPYAAAVMLDLRDNSVLALVGHSSMDPEVDPLSVVTEAWAPAASTFKVVTTAALLDTGAATPSTRVCFNGGLHGIEDEQLRDDPARDTRCETLADAVAHSYNLVIGKLALNNLSDTQLLSMAKALQFETRIPFEFAVEPSPAHIPGDPVERAKVAAGFWNVDLSPVHGAVLASILGRGGVYQPPHIIAQVIGPDGSDLTPSAPDTSRVLAKDVATQLGEMMVATTVDGTARKSFIDKQGNPYVPGATVAGKTGSLTGKLPPALNYNWFIGFAPADRPEIAFAVLLGNSPKWRIKAHYAARRLVQIYLERRAEIARQRDARLTSDALLLPKRDASGALVQANPPTPAAADAPPDPDPEAAPQDASAKPDLPPPPTGDLPPVPGPIAKQTPGA